jgi:hypothetical protein
MTTEERAAVLIDWYKVLHYRQRVKQAYRGG